MTYKAFQAALVLMIAPVAAGAQGILPAANSGQASVPFGFGEQSLVRYSGQTLPKNFVSIDMDTEASYDDNVRGNNARRQGDFVYGFGPRLTFGEERKALSFVVDYRPDFLLHQRIGGFNQVNQALELEVTYHVSPHLGVRILDSSYYRNGIFQPHSSEAFVSGQGSPISLNKNVFVPLTREFNINSRLDVSYQKSARTTMTVFGDFLKRDFKQVSARYPSLLNTRGWDSGMQYSYLVNAHTNFGVVYLLQNLNFGNYSRFIIQSGFLSLTRQMSTGVALQVFAGPQYTRLHDRFTGVFPTSRGQLPNVTPIFLARWHPAVGGTLTRQSDKTVLQMGVQRLATDGGGLLTAVTTTLAELELRRRLTRRWDTIWNLNGEYASSLSSRLLNARINGQSAGFAIERSMTEALTAHIGYSYMRQRRGSHISVLPDIDRNRISIGLYYHLGKFDLGR